MGMTELDKLLLLGGWAMNNPTAKADLLLDYPELRKIPEFMALSKPQDMLFVWHYASKSSRARTLKDDSARIAYALHRAWDGTPPKDVSEKYAKRQWGEATASAIAVMRSMEPEPRRVLQLTCLHLLEQVKGLLNIPAPQGGDWEASAAYFKAVKDGMILVQQLLPLTEAGAFGIVGKTKEEEDEDAHYVNAWHRKRGTQ